MLTGAFFCVPFASGFKKGLLNATDYTEVDVVAESIRRVVTGIKSLVDRGTRPVVLKVVPVTGAAIFQVTMDQLICTSLFSHPPLNEVCMLKEGGIQYSSWILLHFFTLALYKLLIRKISYFVFLINSLQKGSDL